VKGLELAQELGMMLDVKGMAREFAFDVAGDLLDVGMHLSGEPECWMVETDSANSVSRQSRVKRLMIETCVSAGVSTEVMTQRGVALMQMIDMLESSNVRVELYVMMSSGHDKSRSICHIQKVKDADQPLNRAHVLYWVAHPSALRRLGFGAFEIGTHLSGKPFNFGYGAPATFSKEFADAFCASERVDIDAHLNAGIFLGQATTPQQATELVRKRAQELIDSDN
jgi:hypothetical protein